MSVKTFTTETLTSADTNTYLANSGLVYVTSATIGSGVSSVTVSSAFNSTYDDYKIIISGGATSSTQNNLTLKLGSSTSTYYGSFIYAAFATGAVLGAGINNAANFTFVGGVDVNSVYCNIELQCPFLAKYTNIQALTVGYSTIRGSATGEHETATSYSAFTLAPASGTLTGGTITVYGYRKA